MIYYFLSSVGNPTQQRYCAVTVQHIQIWHEIAASKSALSLVLEDDAIFVPFFKEKFNRFVYTAIRTGALKIGETQCATPRANLSSDEWINQDPAFVIGACANLRDPSFPPEIHDAPPMLSTHREKFSRCSHAYVLTRCSAQALLKQMHVKKIPFYVVDWLQTYLAKLSPTLQPFWLDPGIAYQGSQAHDLDKVTTFGRSMTQED
jgi:GR25 family glycosyltransferase involved in LPS biosynthesis